MSLMLTASKRMWTLSSSSLTTRKLVLRSLSSSVDKNTLNRKDLAGIIADEHDLSMAQSERIVKSIFDTIVEKVSDKGVVRIADFGTFYSQHVEARTYRNPGTGEPVPKPAVDRPKFKAYDSFKKSVNR